MAKRESQGLQIALILFVMITAVLAVTTYVYWSKSEDRAKATADAQQQAATAKKQYNSIYDEMVEVKKWLGYDSDAQFANMKEDYTADMLQYAAGLNSEDQNYRKIPGHLLTAMVERNLKLVEANTNLANLTKEIEALRAAEAAREEGVKVAVTKISQDAVSIRDRFDERIKAVLADKEKLAAQVTLKAKEFDTEVTAKSDEINRLEKRLTTVDRNNKLINKQLKEFETEEYDTPDGKITWVNQAANTVWINLGTADGLRRQISFSVYDVDQNNLATARKKGSIEVTQIKGPHLAEARIVDAESGDPLLPKDVIYTPLWRPGKAVRFALVGFMDIDGDSRSDLEKLRNLISLNAGVIDAEVDEAGKRTGKLDVHTRYLVVGERPTDNTSPEVLRGYTNMIGEAESLGVEQISLDKLLSMMGYKAEQRTVLMGGRGAGGEQLQPKPGGAAPKSTGNTSELFRDRQPPGTGARRSAF